MRSALLILEELDMMIIIDWSLHQKLFYELESHTRGYATLGSRYVEYELDFDGASTMRGSVRQISILGLER